MLLAWNNCEGGSSLICTNLDGRKLWGWRSDPSLPYDTMALAADDRYIYLAKSGWGWPNREKHGAGVVRFKLDGSAAPWPKEQGGTYLIVVRPYVEEPQGTHPPLLGGIAARNRLLYLSFTRENLIEIRSAESGELKDTISLEQPRHIETDNDGTLVVASGTRVVRVDPRTKQVTVLREGLKQAYGVALAAGAGQAGTIYVSDYSGQQIVALDRSGTEQRRIGRAGGRQTAGAWQADGLLHPVGIEVDALGRVWCAEMDLSPKRFSVWGAEGKLAKELVGPTFYGCGDSFLDAFDHSIGYSTGTRFKIDYANKTYAPIAVNGRNDRPGALLWPTWSGRFVTCNGKRYYTDEGPRRTPVIFAYEPDRMRALATVGVVRELQDSGLFAGVKAIARAKPMDWYSWSDRNGDALVQAEEVQVVPSPTGAGMFTYWGSLPGDDLTITLPSGGRYWQFAVTGWTPAGAPVYDLTQAKELARQKGEAGYVAMDAEHRVLIRGDPIMAYRPDGSIDWTYPSRYAMHGRPGVPAPGRIIEVHRITGLAPLPKEAGGQLFAMNGNNGEWYFMTTDGVYIQKIFRDFRVGGHKGPEYFISQESFGGHFVRTADDGKYYLVSGNTDARVFRLDGVESIRRFPAAKLAFTAEHFATAGRMLADEAFERKKRADARVPRAVPEAEGFVATWPDGSLTEWTALNGQAVAVRKAWSEDSLYLRWDVNDPTPLVNGGENAKLLFKYGDSVDLQIASDPRADPQRREPAAGDVRLLITEAKGRPVAVLYEPVTKGTKDKVAFSSPWRTISFDRVRDVTAEVKLRLTRRQGGYSVEAAVPWSLLGFKPAAGDSLRGDLGVLFGNESGELTLLRSYWSNDNTSIVSDVPSEAALEPRQWGVFGFE